MHKNKLIHFGARGKVKKKNDGNHSKYLQTNRNTIIILSLYIFNGKINTFKYPFSKCLPWESLLINFATNSWIGNWNSVPKMFLITRSKLNLSTIEIPSRTESSKMTKDFYIYIIQTRKVIVEICTFAKIDRYRQIKTDRQTEWQTYIS